MSNEYQSVYIYCDMCRPLFLRDSTILSFESDSWKLEDEIAYKKFCFAKYGDTIFKKYCKIHGKVKLKPKCRNQFFILYVLTFNM